MVYHQEKIQELNWGLIEKRFESNPQISDTFVTHLKELFIGHKSFNETDFNAFHLSEVFSYLKISHTAYLDILLPKIENTLHELCARDRSNNIALKVLQLFIEKYKKELVNHILHEEEVLFNFVEGLLEGEYSTQSKNFVMMHFLHTHNDNIILSLDELKADFINFDEDLSSNLAFQVLFDQLNCFQQDLAIHGMIEDTIFIKKILAYIHQNFEVLDKIDGY